MKPDRHSALPIPAALYACKICYTDYSWPADDLFWSALKKAWICRECWDDEWHGEQGTSLDLEIKRQEAARFERLATERATATPDSTIAPVVEPSPKLPVVP